MENVVSNSNKRRDADIGLSLIHISASTDGEIVGKLYNNSVGTLVAKDGDWYQVKSGSVEGYVKAEYFKTGWL